MNHPELQSDFSKVFAKYKKANITNKNKEATVEHPFSFLDFYYSNSDKFFELTKFEVGFNFYSELKTQKKHSYNCFEYELSLLDKDKYLYINEVTSLLYKISQKFKTYQTTFNYTNFYFRTISQIASNILKDIFMYYHLDLDSRNRERLSKWFHLKEPIISFRFSKHQEEKRLENLFNKYLVYENFVSFSAPFSTFKALFEGRLLENKINWIHNKSSLYYFIKLLVSNKVVKNPKNRHWLITSEFFLLKGETLLPNDFLNQKETQKKDKRIALENFVKALKQ